MTNKELLNQALRHVHFAQGLLQRVETDRYLDYADIWDALSTAEDYIIELRELNENNSSNA